LAKRNCPASTDLSVGAFGTSGESLSQRQQAWPWPCVSREGCACGDCIGLSGISVAPSNNLAPINCGSRLGALFLLPLLEQLVSTAVWLTANRVFLLPTPTVECVAELFQRSSQGRSRMHLAQ